MILCRTFNVKPLEETTAKLRACLNSVQRLRADIVYNIHTYSTYMYIFATDYLLFWLCKRLYVCTHA